MDLPEDYVQTCISLTKKQRQKLQWQQDTTKQSMSDLVRDAIDARFPDPPPPIADLTPNLQKLQSEKKAVTVLDRSDPYFEINQIKLRLLNQK